MKSKTLEKRVKEVSVSKRPGKRKGRFVGVEIECFTKLTREALIERFAKAGLHKYVNVWDDGSICPPSGKHSTELRVLVHEKEVPSVIRRVCSVLKDVEGDANKSCGLHVHLDCRKRDHEEVYFKLVTALPLLKMMVSRSRRENDYCEENESRELENGQDAGRESAVNGFAYDRHKTIEVRLHSGTVTAEKIINWIQLLIAIADGPVLYRFPESLSSVARTFKLRRGLVEYIAKRIANFNQPTRDGALPFLTPQQTKRFKPEWRTNA